MQNIEYIYLVGWVLAAVLAIWRGYEAIQRKRGGPDLGTGKGGKTR